MAARKRGAAGRGRINRSLVLLGDARPSSSPVWENGRLSTPTIGLWMRADDGLLWSVHVGPAGDRAAALLEALVNPSMPALPGLPRPTGLPREVVLFDEALARQIMPRLPDSRIEVSVAPPFAPFEEAFTSLLDVLAPKGDPTLKLPDETLAALCVVCERLWQVKPWQVADDHPLIEIRPRARGVRRVYASVLGAARQVYGVALYASLKDYERDSEHGALRQLAEDMLGAAELAGLADRERAQLEAQIDAQLGLDPAAYARSGGRVLLVSFDPRGSMRPEYREQLARNGWPEALDVVPTFIGRGGRDDESELAPQEAATAVVALDALLTFVDLHEDAIVDEAFPIADTVAVSLPQPKGAAAGTKSRNLHVEVSMPPAATRPRPRA